MVDLSFTRTFLFYEKPKTKQPALRDLLRHFHEAYRSLKVLIFSDRKYKENVPKNTVYNDFGCKKKL